MPEYKATIFGENFEFIIDESPQHLDFLRTIYIDAENENAAKSSAITKVREELIAQSLWNEESEQMINLNSVQQVDPTINTNSNGDFIWAFPDYIELDDD